MDLLYPERIADFEMRKLHATDYSEREGAPGAGAGDPEVRATLPIRLR
jgi:hypothetical protein